MAIDPIKEVVVIYPNPTAGGITVRWNTYYDRRLILTVFDVQGQPVKKVQIESGINQIQVDLSDRHTGMYLMELKDSMNGMIINRSKIVKH